MKEYDHYHDIDDTRFYQILTNMTKDDEYCFHCIERHVRTDALQSYIDKDSITRERNENLKVTRTLLNILSTSNARRNDSLDPRLKQVSNNIYSFVEIFPRGFSSQQS